jgi:hypothetical protein
MHPVNLNYQVKKIAIHALSKAIADISVYERKQRFVCHQIFAVSQFATYF